MFKNAKNFHWNVNKKEYVCLAEKSTCTADSPAETVWQSHDNIT